MHKRIGSYVVNESGRIHVIPAGEFTPSDVSYEALRSDFNLWRNIMREYAEEFLNIEETYGRGGQSINYDGAFPFAALSKAMASGRLRVAVFGVAMDALCLKPSLLTTCVCDSEIFDKIFRNMVSVDEEGVLVTGRLRHGIPFTDENVELYTSDPDTSVAGVACLRLAWSHRADLGLET